MSDFNPVYVVTDPASPTSGKPIRKLGIVILVGHGRKVAVARESETSRPDGR